MSNVIRDVDGVRRRADADRPGPAVPLLLLGLVVVGALVVALIRASHDRAAGDGSRGTVLVAHAPWTDPVRLSWWVFASLAAYLLAIWIARREGYRRGVWVDRLPLALGGLGALLMSVIVQRGWFAPGDLLIRGNVPLLAIAVGIAAWAVQERRFGLWLLAAVILPLTLLANLYNMENVISRIGAPALADADEIVGLGTVALVLIAAAAIFAIGHRHQLRAARGRGSA